METESKVQRLPAEQMFQKEIDHDAALLLKAMVLGLEDLAKEYKKYIRLNYKEV